MSETYEITEDETGEELLVQRVICTKCNAYEFMIPSKAAQVDDSWRCKTCTLPEGVTKSVRRFEQCSQCSEVYDVRDPKCFCFEKPKPLLTYSHSSKELMNPVTKRLENEIEEGKLQTEEKKIVRNSKREAIERQIRMDKNLEKLVELLSKEKNVQKEV